MAQISEKKATNMTFNRRAPTFTRSLHLSTATILFLLLAMDESMATTARRALRSLQEQRFSGFEFVEKHDPSTLFSRETARFQDMDYDHFPDEPDNVDIPRTATAVRVTPDGSEYRATLERRDRSLIVLGTDSRQIVQNTLIDPFDAIAELDFSYRKGGCSASLIGPNAFVTAGHCVYNKGKWSEVAYMSPGRYRDSSGSQVDPHGRWSVESLTILEEWMVYGGRQYDVAVVTVYPRRTGGGSDCRLEYPGDHAGYFTLATATDENLVGASISGYPADRLDGQMWHTGVCSEQGAWQLSNSIPFAHHFCDTAPGMSGAPMVTNNGVVVGVHAYGFPSSQRNGGVAFDELYLEDLQQIAGDPARLPRTCYEYDNPESNPEGIEEPPGGGTVAINQEEDKFLEHGHGACPSFLFFSNCK